MQCNNINGATSPFKKMFKFILSTTVSSPGSYSFILEIKEECTVFFVAITPRSAFNCNNNISLGLIYAPNTSVSDKEMFNSSLTM